jgi:PAS domain S-box-containing protein
MAQLRHLALVWLAGGVALGLVTWASFELRLDASAAKCIYLTAIVFLSLMDSFVSSIVFCVVAILCIDFFFTEPRFTFQIRCNADLASITTFLISSLVITALVRYVRTLVEVQREQARLLDLTHDTVIVRDMDGVTTYWNCGAEALYGWKRDETLGKVVHGFLHTRFPAPLDEITDTLMCTGRWEGELVHTKRDGSEVVIASRWSLQRNENGRPLATLETGNDITARKRAEDALRQIQATYLAEAQKLSRTGSFGWNARSGEVFWSEQTFRIYGYEPGVVPTLDLVLQRVHPDDVAYVREKIRQAAAARHFEFEHRLLLPDGSVKHLHVVAHAITAEADKPQFAGAIMDITEARQAEQQLHDAQSELCRVTRVTTLGELSASIAHEVRQPLAAIVTNAGASLRWLGHRPQQLDEVREGLTRIAGDARRATEIVHRIRTMATKDSGPKAPLALNDVVNDVLSLTQHEVLSHQVSLRLKLAPSLPPLLGDRVQLQQVIINLVMNAIQSMEGISDRPRELSIESSPDQNGHVVLAVRDCGTGIDPENANRLFDAFFSTKPQGMGMGLSICRSIIERHGGTIEAANNAGHGVTFRCLLPPISEVRHDSQDGVQSHSAGPV